eukprot:7476364-Ditylum_brightwellii.AAC.1
MDHIHWIKPYIPPTSYTSTILKSVHGAYTNTEQHSPPPLPPDYVYFKENRPSSKEEEDAIKEKFPGLDFRSLVCSL